MVDHDVHFRAGVGARGEETFTPRTLIYDLKGSFGGLRKWGGLYDQQQLDEGFASGEAEGAWYRFFKGHKFSLQAGSVTDRPSGRIGTAILFVTQIRKSLNQTTKGAWMKAIRHPTNCRQKRSAIGLISTTSSTIHVL